MYLSLFFDVSFVLDPVRSVDPVGLLVRVLPPVLNRRTPGTRRPLQLSKEAQLGVDLLEGVAGDDLGQQHEVGLVALPVRAEQPTELVTVLTKKE